MDQRNQTFGRRETQQVRQIKYHARNLDVSRRLNIWQTRSSSKSRRPNTKQKVGLEKDLLAKKVVSQCHYIWEEGSSFIFLNVGHLFLQCHFFLHLKYIIQFLFLFNETYKFVKSSIIKGVGLFLRSSERWMLPLPLHLTCCMAHLLPYFLDEKVDDSLISISVLNISQSLNFFTLRLMGSFFYVVEDYL